MDYSLNRAIVISTIFKAGITEKPKPALAGGKIRGSGP
jgi:hypothetical protein